MIKLFAWEDIIEFAEYRLTFSVTHYYCFIWRTRVENDQEPDTKRKTTHAKFKNTTVLGAFGPLVPFRGHQASKNAGRMRFCMVFSV